MKEVIISIDTLRSLIFLIFGSILLYCLIYSFNNEIPKDNTPFKYGVGDVVYLKPDSAKVTIIELIHGKKNKEYNIQYYDYHWRKYESAIIQEIQIYDKQK